MKKFFICFLVLCLVFLSGCKSASSKKYPPKSPMGDDGAATVLIDAGHGFRDVGCGSEYLGDVLEYELTMDFARRLHSKLTEQGINVILTHDGLTYPAENELCLNATEAGIDFEPEKISFDNGVFDAYERAVYANVLDTTQEIDLFLSIHVNANAESNTPEGFEIDYCAENDSSEMSVFAFNSICSALERSYPDRRLKKFADSWDMSFIVTKYTSMPSILFETGFASTPSDALLLLDEDWRDALMTSIASGISAYFELEQKK